MINLKDKVKHILPEYVKAVIRPYYQKMRQTPPDTLHKKPSMLAIHSFGGFDVAYRKRTADDDVIAHSFDNDIFFTGTPEYQPKEGDVIIDMGAHIGTFSLLASAKVGSGKVYAIEACKETFNLLRINVALNQCNNISVHHTAMSDKEGMVTLHYDMAEGNWGHSTVKKLSEFNETVNSSTLPDFMKKNHIDKCHFMKLNIEGAEFPVLLSTPKDVLQRFGTILALYHCDLWGKNTEDDLTSHLESSGFDCIIRNQTESRGWIIATNTMQI